MLVVAVSDGCPCYVLLLAWCPTFFTDTYWPTYAPLPLLNTHTLSLMGKTEPCFVFFAGKISVRLHNEGRPPFSPPPPTLSIRALAFFLGQERANSSPQSSREGGAMQLCLLWQKVNINFHQWGKFTHMILFVLHYQHLSLGLGRHNCLQTQAKQMQRKGK